LQKVKSKTENKIEKFRTQKKGEEEGTSSNWAVPGAQNQPEQASARTPSLCSSFFFLFFFFSR
jgi:hypothetical protein